MTNKKVNKQHPFCTNQNVSLAANNHKKQNKIVTLSSKIKEHTYTLDSYTVEALPFVSAPHRRLSLTVRLGSCIPWGPTVLLSSLSNLTSLTLWNCMRFLPCRNLGHVEASLLKLPELPQLERLVIEPDSGNFAVPSPHASFPTTYLELFPMPCPALRELCINVSLSLRAFQTGTSSFPTTLMRLSLTLTSNLEHPADLEPFFATLPTDTKATRRTTRRHGL